MPIYEYICEKCNFAFEALVPRPSAKAPCPECGSKKVSKQISVPGGFSISGASGESCPASGGPRPEQCNAGG